LEICFFQNNSIEFLLSSFFRPKKKADNAKKIGSTALGIALTVGGIIFGGKKK
jgi:hypothetical protein